LNRTAQTVTNNLNNIIGRYYPNESNGTYPRILQSDNGGEFSNALMTAFCNNNNIQHILSSSHHPSANDKVERKNREMRKKLKAGFIRQNSNLWNVSMLRDYTKNINNQVNAKTKLRAIGLYSNGYTQQPLNLPNNPVLNNNSTQQE
jgi:transposase InsO family protein